MLKKSVYSSVKESKPFEFGDLFVYVITLAAVLVLFAAFVIFPGNSPAKGFTVTLKGERVLVFDSDELEFLVEDQFAKQVSIEEIDGGYRVTVYCSENSNGYNVIFFDTTAKTAEVLESNCSNSKDCTFSPKIKDDGTIYCAPHGLKVAPSVSSGFIDPIVG